MSSLINAQTIGIACGVGFIAYCIYFDHKRRNAPDYKEKVKAKREQAILEKEKEDEIILPSLEDKEATEKFFIGSLEKGEELMQAGETDRAVKHLSYAVVLCPQPQQLLAYMREILPTSSYKKLVEQIADVNQIVKDTYNKRQIEEDDVE